MFLKYRELKLSLIPLKPGQKRPAECGWERFCDHLPTAAEAEAWERGNFGFGLALGPASNLIALDIDSDDVNVLNVCKTSPVRKRGKKGETRFFKFCPSVVSTKVAGCIDILARGRQTVLPPSIHPDTGQPYVWTTDDTLENYDLSRLPIFTSDDIVSMKNTLEVPPQSAVGWPKIHASWRAKVSQPIRDGERNSTLTSVAGGLLRCGLPPEHVYDYIIFLNQAKSCSPLYSSEVESILLSIMKKEYRRRAGSGA